ncbi:hypothetical protein FOL47_009987 [Perkinsus chesapeaki]|uniref:JmjC domain-containing protein n=1 Tax=Perkinsus chesapeaki TaxID=330153 RepID=A0A7J6L5H8_PERCH|nr:hypothetical protein FOL47_009987 [Perkinsus chesapeaki]
MTCTDFSSSSFLSQVEGVDEATEKLSPQYVSTLKGPTVFRGAAESIKNDFTGEKLIEEYGDRRLPLSLTIEERSDKPTGKATTSMREYINGNVKGYLKQVPVADKLTEEFKPLIDDTFYGNRKDTLYMWVGRASEVTETGIHSDDENNILVQLQGVKRVVLFPPDSGDAVYVNDKYDDGTRCCDADVYAKNWEEKWPKLSKVQKNAVKVTLMEGDVLYFPRNWYHDVRILPEDNMKSDDRLGLSVSVNVFSTWRPRYLIEEGGRVALRCFDKLASLLLKSTMMINLILIAIGGNTIINLVMSAPPPPLPPTGDYAPQANAQLPPGVEDVKVKVYENNNNKMVADLTVHPTSGEPVTIKELDLVHRNKGNTDEVLDEFAKNTTTKWQWNFNHNCDANEESSYINTPPRENAVILEHGGNEELRGHHSGTLGADDKGDIDTVQLDFPLDLSMKRPREGIEWNEGRKRARKQRNPRRVHPDKRDNE